jgi:two-component system nitrogen regulation response regulator NtrX
MVIMTPGEVITPAQAPPPVSAATPASPSGMAYASHATLRDARPAFERDFITQKLRENGWNISKTADALGIERSNLHKKINALGIETAG